MARIEFAQNLHDWRWNMLIPQMCDVVWKWAMEAALIAGKVNETPGAKWTPPPLPMIDPAVEGKAIRENVRAGIQTLPDALREQGHSDFEEFLDEYEESNNKLDERGIILDSDARNTTQAGNPRDQVQPTDTQQADGGTDNADNKAAKPTKAKKKPAEGQAALSL
jgi:capsid protein